ARRPGRDHRARRGEQPPGQPLFQLADRALVLAQPQEQRELPGGGTDSASPGRFDLLSARDAAWPRGGADLVLGADPGRDAPWWPCRDPWSASFGCWQRPGLP